jgi:trimeric autotransporter adhesin
MIKKISSRGRWFTRFITCAAMATFAISATTALHAQVTISGGSSAAGSHTTLASAITALNGSTITAPVVVDVAAGHTETLSGKIIMTATGTATNTITIQKSGSGSNPVLTSYAGTVATPSTVADGFFVLAGSDFVTIDGIDLQENAANTSTTSVMEFGYAMFKASVADGCQYNTIKNCTITLNRLQNTAWTAPGHNGSTGITIANGLYTASGAIVPTAASGSNSNNAIIRNTIQNCNAGISVLGYAATLGVGPTPNPTSFLGDLNNVVGGSIGNGNTIRNFGGGAVTNPASGIFANNNWSMNVSHNTVNNNTGAGVNHATTLRGIFMNSSSISANATCNNNTVVLTSGATTSNLEGITCEFGGTAAANTVEVSNNDLTLSYPTATSGLAYGIYCTSNPTNLKIWGNTVHDINYSSTTLTGSGVIYLIYTSGASGTTSIRQNTLLNITRSGNASGGNTIGIYTSAGTNQIVRSNTISNFNSNGTGTGGAIYGIQTAIGTVSVDSNAISNLKNNRTTATGIMYGIYNISAPTNESITYNTVSALNNFGTGTTYGIYHFTTTGLRNVVGNSVNGVSGAGINIAGIAMASSSPTIVANKIFNVSSTSSVQGVVSGLLISSLGTNGVATVYNNIIGDLRAPTSTYTATPVLPNVRGISILVTATNTSVNLYHNTVYLAAASTGATFGSAGIYQTYGSAATTAALTMRNNNVVNLSTANGAAVTAAYQRSLATDLLNYASASNNNNFYAGVPSSTNLIYFDGTNSEQTLAGFQTRVSPREASSVSEDATFASTVPADPNYLHIDLTTPTQLESGATFISTVTTDFDGDLRSTTTPDIGADEFVGTGIDIIAPGISYTPVGITCATAGVTLIAAVTDASGVPATGIDVPHLYYNVNNGAYTSVAGTNIGSVNYSFTFASGVVAGDVIKYYIVAQDILGNIGALPAVGAAGFSISPPAVSTPPTTPSTFTIGQVLSGTYSVGIGQTYATITDAINAYNANCLGGAVVFELTDASYSTAEIFPINIAASAYANATNTLTIRPAASVTCTISGAVAAGALIKYNGADYITIDGSNSGGTDRSLTISNTTTTSTGNAALWLAAPTAGNGCTSNTIKNCIFQGLGTTSGTTGLTGLYIGGATAISTTAAGFANNNNITVTNNQFSKYMFGMITFGYAAASPDTNIVISGNLFGGSSSAEACGFTGLHSDRSFNTLVDKNEVAYLQIPTLNASSFYGMRLLDFRNGVCSNNNLHDFTGLSVSSPKLYGILVASSTYTTAAAPSNSLVYNNIIANLSSAGTSGVWNITGLHVGQGFGNKVYYNSVQLGGGTIGSASGLSAAFANGDGSTTVAGANIDVRNNIFNVEGTSSGGNVFAYYTTATTLTGSTINYNLLRSAATGGTVNNTGRLVSNYATLADWQTATGMDANSVNAAPIFVSGSNLHLQPVGANTAINNAGTPIAGITVDIDNDVRNSTTPDIGADEFVVPTCMGAPSAGTIAGPAALCDGTIGTFTSMGSSSGLGISYQWMQSSTTGGPYTNITGATNTTLMSGFPIGTVYLVLQTTCATSGLSAQSNEMAIVVTPLPVVSASSAAPVYCIGSAAIALTATGASTYTWSPSANLSSATGATTNSTPSVGTIYTVVGADALGCAATSTVTVSVGFAPSVSGATASPANVCYGSSSTLSATITNTIPGVGAYNFTSANSGTYAPLSGAGISTINTVAQLSVMANNNQDDGGVLVTLPFSFPYVGGSFTQATMCTNGWVGLGNQTATTAVESRTAANAFTATAPNNIFAAWMKDMGANFPTGTGSMRHGLVGTDIYAFQWDDAVGSGFSDGSANKISFQVNLYGPNSISPGKIQYVYGPTAGTTVFGAAIAIEDGTSGSNHYINAVNGTTTSTVTATAWPGNGTVYEFTPAINLSYAWTPASNLGATATLASAIATSNVASTTYTLTATNGACSSTGTVALNVINNNSQTTDTACNSYLWSATATTYTVSGVYTNVVTNAITGCQDTAVLNLTINNCPAPSITNVGVGCNNQDDKSIEMDIVNGTAPFTVSLTPNLGFAVDSVTYVSLPAGSYTITVTDANGFTGVTSTVISNPTAVAATSAITSVPTCFGGSDGTITISASGGTAVAGYIIDWYDNAASYPLAPVFSGNANTAVSVASAPTYTVYVTDDFGCSDTLSGFTITQPALISTIDSASGCDTVILAWGDTVTSAGTYTNMYVGGASNGCDSISNVYVTINTATNSSIIDTACNSYSWNGMVYTASGIFYHSYINAGGCPSTDTLTLTINVSNNTTATQSACNTYTWNGNTYSASGTYYQYTTNAAGCLDTAELVLTINNSNNTTVMQTACNSYSWNGTTYTMSGTYYNYTTNVNGCADTATLVLVINNSSNTTTSQTACNSYTWNGNTYSTNGTYYNYTTGSNGCADTATLVLTINVSNNTSTTQTACNSYVWNGTTYYTTGTYYQYATNAAGCQDTATLLLTINNSNNTTMMQTACNNYTWNGNTYATSGTYYNYTTGTNGCADTATLVLTIYNSNNTSTTQSACNSYTWNGNTYTTSGTYYNYTTGTNGCADTATLVLTINVSNNTSTAQTACNSYVWNGIAYNTSGTYYQYTTNAAGCQDTATLVLTINTSSNTTVMQTACNSYTWNGNTYTVSGTYYNYTTGTNGCADTTTLILTINNSNNTSTSQSACNSYTWNSTTYTTSGTYYNYTTGTNGCADTATLILTINVSNNTSTAQTACNSYMWNGTTYTSTGTYYQYSTNAAGCQDTATLLLTINNSNNTTVMQSACNTYTWNGNTYATSGTYYNYTTGTNGCADTATLVLTINPNYSVSTTVSAPFSYVLPWGSTVTSNGTYAFMYTSINGCDSLSQYFVTITGVRLAAKALLSGPLVGATLMNDNLRAANIIPSTEPYGSMNTFPNPYTPVYTHVAGGGGELVGSGVFGVTGPDAIVDWVFVQLRSTITPFSVVATRSALIQRDGDIVDVDGVSPLEFPALVPANYHVSIKHRNHAGVMTGTAVALNATASVVDFTNVATGLYARATPQNNPAPLTGASKIVGTKRALYAGNCNITNAAKDKIITFNSTTSSDRAQLLLATPGTSTLTGYSVFDCDMNGFARFNGTTPDRLVILITCANSNSIILYEQLP